MTTAKTKKAEASMTQTAGVSDDAEAIETPYMGSTGPRDALIDPAPEDFVPDVDTKGYHVGMVRQPAELVGVGGVPQGFRSVSEHESKFAHGSLKALKAAHNGTEKGLGEAAAPDPSPQGVFMPGLGFVSSADAHAAASSSRKPAKATPAENDAPVDVDIDDGSGDDGDSDDAQG